MRRTLRWSSAAAIAALALSGCVRTTVDTTISSDDTFSQHSIVAFSDEVASQIGAQAGIEIAGMLDELGSSPEFLDLQERYPGQVEVVDYVDEDLHGIELTVSDLPLTEFNAATAQAGTGLTGAATLTRTDDTFVVEMSIPEQANLDDLGVSQSQLNLLASSVDVAITYTFPGPIEQASAGTVEGHTVTLGLSDLLGGGDIRIVAAAGDSIDWGPILTWGGIALAFILVIGGATALVIQDRRASRRNTLPPPQASTTAGGPGVLDGTAADGEPATDDDPRIGPIDDADEGER